jgi:hypothetical protein
MNPTDADRRAAADAAYWAKVEALQLAAERRFTALMAVDWSPVDNALAAKAAR